MYQVEGLGFNLCHYLLFIWRHNLFYCARYFKKNMNGSACRMIVDECSLVRLTIPHQKGH